jgi:hypothetical protein
LFWISLSVFSFSSNILIIQDFECLVMLGSVISKDVNNLFFLHFCEQYALAMNNQFGLPNSQKNIYTSLPQKKQPSSLSTSLFFNYKEVFVKYYFLY